MKRFLRIVLPILVLALVFVGVYFWTLPRPSLPDFAEVQSALNTLDKYGYESSQITKNLNCAHLGLCFLGFVLAVGGYFWLYDYGEKRKILSVIDYVRKINDKIYDLKLDENSEGELSLLTNELYKTTVLLQKTAEADQKRAQNMETALADISHQLRTPLASLQITLDNIYDHPELSPRKRQEFLRIATRQVEQMSELVVTLLNLAKLDNGTLRMRPRTITAAKLLQDVAERLEVLAEIREVELKVTGDLTAKLKLDPKWQAEALMNIVKNCIEYSAPGQTVDISVTSKAVYTRITVSDAGMGISQRDLPHIFERFYKAENARAESTGIGLAFAKTLIEANGGQVKARSEEDTGTQYEITYFS